MSDPTEIIIENGETVPTQVPLATERQQKRTHRKLLPKLLRVAGRIHLRCLTILELAILAIIIGNLVQLKIFRFLLLAT